MDSTDEDLHLSSSGTQTKAREETDQRESSRSTIPLDSGTMTAVREESEQGYVAHSTDKGTATRAREESEQDASQVSYHTLPR